MINKENIVKYLKNKYIIAVIVFALLLLFFDRNDIFTQMERKKELNKILASQEFYNREIDSTKQKLSELRTDPSALEHYAREELFMRKDSEDIFVLEKSDSLLNK
ncbi:MAG: septum formation initiator [Pseudopedobacter saltans]|uniref:Septum formation initiator n=1 Tax=Pseudopedobacter saltans TaxID=151895 RepID=A0A2W5FAT1_9SPHI|nr:MAG: septum formation initiator [Pseudopedobacter saltans]